MKTFIFTVLLVMFLITVPFLEGYKYFAVLDDAESELSFFKKVSEISPCSFACYGIVTDQPIY